VFVGPNNAGKTNLSDSLEFLGQVARSGLEVAVSREGGFENLAFRRSRRTRQPVRFSFKATTPALASLGRFADRRERRAFENLSISVAYEFQLRASSESRDADFRVTEEDLEMCLLDGAAENLARVRMTRRETDVSVTVDGLRNTESGEAVDTEDPFEDFFDPFPLSGFDDYLERTLEPTALALTRAGVLNTPIRELESWSNTTLSADAGGVPTFRLRDTEPRARSTRSQPSGRRSLYPAQSQRRMGEDTHGHADDHAWANHDPDRIYDRSAPSALIPRDRRAPMDLRGSVRRNNAEPCSVHLSL